MPDRNAGNDNEAPEAGGEERDDWVLPVPPTGTPAYALIPWNLFQRLLAHRRAASRDAADNASLEDDFAAMPIRELDAAALPVSFDESLPFGDDAAGTLWPKSGDAIDGYGDDSANGAIPLALLDRLLDGEHPLKVFRRHRGLTQKELAHRTGLNATYLSQIETRKRGGSTRVYRLLAAALNVEIGDLIE